MRGGTFGSLVPVSPEASSRLVWKPRSGRHGIGLPGMGTAPILLCVVGQRFFSPVLMLNNKKLMPRYSRLLKKIRVFVAGL